MYLAPLKGLIVTALKQTLTQSYPVEQLRGIHTSIEYPIEETEFPAIWVDYDDTEALRKAGVDYEEILTYTDSQNVTHEDLVARWRFTGFVSLTIVALSSFERDLAYDELVGMVAFGKQDPDRSVFLRIIEDNDFLAVNMDSDTIQPRGAVAAPGTPWGTDELVYERTINLNVIGEFIPDPRESGTLARLSEIVVKAYNLADPTQAAALEASQSGVGVTAWH